LIGDNISFADIVLCELLDVEQTSARRRQPWPMKGRSQLEWRQIRRQSKEASDGVVRAPVCILSHSFDPRKNEPIFLQIISVYVE